MSTNIKLFVSCHKPGIHIPDNPLLQPIHVGAAISNVTLPGMLRDDGSDNISAKNRSYCELTAQYWAWKNVDADYYGFLHYRRYFNFSGKELPIHHEPFIFGDVVEERNDDATLKLLGNDEATMRRVIESHDFIAPTMAYAPDVKTVYEHYQYSAGHHIEDLDTVLDIIKLKYPEIWPSAERYINQKGIYACNMFVMNRELFHEYSAFLFDVLAEHEKLTDISHYTAVARRVSGYLGERLCGMYLTYLYDKGLNGIDLQRVYFKNPNEPGTTVSDDTVETTKSRKKEFIHIENVTRGRGKIYATLSADQNVNAAKFTATSKTEQDWPLPVKVMDTSAFGPLMVLPLTGVSQTVTVQALDKSGTVQNTLVKEITHKEAKRLSQMHTLLRNETATRIRNYDKQPLLGDTRVKVIDVMADADGSDIVQGQIVVPGVKANEERTFIEVKVLDSDGHPLTAGEWTCFSDETEEMENLPGFKVRRISYSVHIPHSTSFMIWVRFPDCATLPDAFEHFDTVEVAEHRQGWQSIRETANATHDYDEWFRANHRATTVELKLQQQVKFDEQPKYSIIVPLYKTPIPFLRDMVKSVQLQTYRNWELLLVNASPDEVELAAAVDGYCKADSRIKHLHVTENKGITLNTNVGIQAATGDFLCFLDHDDVLEPDALYCYTKAVNEHPDTDMLYCDEDKLVDGKYREPFFKTEWNPDLLLGMNYVCHFLTVRKSIMDTLDLPGSEYDGSQDYHMTFRIGEKARYVHHEPRVLYHWRVHEHSTAKRADQKDYALETSRLAIETHLERIGVKGRVVDSPLSPRRFVVEYDLGDHPLVSIIIPNKDALPVLHQCLSAIRKYTTYDNYEIVIVENNSEKPETFAYYDAVQKLDPRIHVATLTGMDSFNFSRIINFGAAHSQGEYLLMLNNDTKVITPNWIEELLGPCTREDVGCTGAKLLFPDGTIQHVGIGFGPSGPGHMYHAYPANLGGNFEATLLARDMGAVTAACLMVSRKVFEAVGGMDEELAVNYNDVDFCLSVLKSGKRVVMCPTAQLYHFESMSRGAEVSGAKALRFQSERGLFMRKWPEVFRAETAPFTNPNLAFGDMFEEINHGQRESIW
ncbi:DUF4422 domain-containing protein [Bifidobacterium leontopitheci]|uniref:Glycosyl transferase family 2 n=1 Tax=Bifidobacterium leontopitheci TaxID=2650774 RepID=A0A6I1GFA9_9BIFI|nr:DUF4422 domain-containing protein [Bifidobacterium leontopitheci]KAB7790333.1 glycosyl transferase family 2 [Bifidobacterium leontopitheci]